MVSVGRTTQQCHGFQEMLHTAPMAMDKNWENVADSCCMSKHARTLRAYWASVPRYAQKATCASFDCAVIRKKTFSGPNSHCQPCFNINISSVNHWNVTCRMHIEWPLLRRASLGESLGYGVSHAHRIATPPDKTPH